MLYTIIIDATGPQLGTFEEFTIALMQNVVIHAKRSSGITCLESAAETNDFCVWNSLKKAFSTEVCDQYWSTIDIVWSSNGKALHSIHWQINISQQEIRVDN